jgi:regulator of sigma E protease
MSIFLFLIVLFVLILVHEWGHFIVAKKTGMRVDEFGIGFPPKLFGIKKGETEYTFNALPIGGFVKIFGENGEQPISPVESEANDRRSESQDEAGEGGTKSVLQSTSNPASATSQYKPDPRAFNNRPKWAQALVLIAGVVMNILFAWLLFSVTYMVGVPTAIEESAAGPNSQLLIAGTLPDSPASAIPAGSQIISVTAGDRTLDTPTPTTFSEFVTATAPAELDVTYQLGGEVDMVTVTPTQGLITDEPDRYAVGASLALIEMQKQPFFTALGNGFTSTVGGLQAITVGLFTLIAQSFAGTADFTQVAGPVGIVGMVGDAAAFGFTALLTFTAVISLNLAVINLLPFPALDGGRLVFVAIEAITGKDIPPEWSGRMNLVGFALLMILMVAVTYNDILNLL